MKMPDQASSVLDISSHLQVPLRHTGESRKTLVKAVEEALSLLGESVAEMVFYNLERSFSLNRNNIVDEPDHFLKALYSMFGSGAAIVEKIIVKSIRETFEIRSLNPSTFCDCVEIVKNRER